LVLLQRELGVLSPDYGQFKLLVSDVKIQVGGDLLLMN